MIRLQNAISVCLGEYRAGIGIVVGVYIAFFLMSNDIVMAQHQTQPPLGIQDEGGTEAKPVFTLNCVGAGIACTQSGTTGTLTVGGGGSGNSFETIAMPAGASVVADSST